MIPAAAAIRRSRRSIGRTSPSSGWRGRIARARSSRRRRSTEGRVRGHADPRRGQAVPQHAVQPGHRARSADRREALGVRRQASIARATTRRSRRAASRPGVTRCPRRCAVPPAHLHGHPRRAPRRPGRGDRDAVRRLRRQRAGRSHARRRPARSRAVPGDVGARDRRRSRHRRLLHRRQSRGRPGARHRARLRRPLGRPALVLGSDSLGQPARRRAPAAATRGRRCRSMRSADSSSSPRAARARITTAASARATTGGPTRSSPCGRPPGSSSGGSRSCTTTSGTTTSPRSRRSSRGRTAHRRSRSRRRWAACSCSTGSPGTPLIPVEERAVPASDIAGRGRLADAALLGHLVVPDRLTAGDAWGATADDLKWCREKIAASRSEGIFTPPSLQGTIVFPGNVGGVNWGSSAYDPERRLLFVNTNRLPFVLRLIPRDKLAAEFAPAPAKRRGAGRARLAGGHTLRHVSRAPARAQRPALQRAAVGHGDRGRSVRRRQALGRPAGHVGSRDGDGDAEPRRADRDGRRPRLHRRGHGRSSAGLRRGDRQGAVVVRAPGRRAGHTHDLQHCAASSTSSSPRAATARSARSWATTCWPSPCPDARIRFTPPRNRPARAGARSAAGPSSTRRWTPPARPR